MKPNSNVVARYAAVLLLLPIVLLAGCEQRNKQQNHQNSTQATQATQATQGTQQPATGGGNRVRLRVVCADDIQKYCADAQRKRRCLRENIDKLSDTCKAALAQHGGHRGRDRDGGDD